MPKKKGGSPEDRDTALPSLLPSQRVFLEGLCVEDDAAFVRGLEGVRAWPSELVCDLYHWCGVLDRIDNLLVSILRDVPEVLCDGGGGGGGGGAVGAAMPLAFYAASERAVHCLRFSALLLRHASNKRMYSSHRLLGAFLGARLCAVTDAALAALLALLEPAAYYGAREEEDMGWVEQDRTLRERLAPLAEPWEGCANRPARDVATLLGGMPGACAVGALRRYTTRRGESACPAAQATLTLLEVVLASSDDALPDTGCRVSLEFPLPAAGAGAGGAEGGGRRPSPPERLAGTAHSSGSPPPGAQRGHCWLCPTLGS